MLTKGSVTVEPRPIIALMASPLVKTKMETRCSCNYALIRMVSCRLHKLETRLSITNAYPRSAIACQSHIIILSVCLSVHHLSVQAYLLSTATAIYSFVMTLEQAKRRPTVIVNSLTIVNGAEVQTLVAPFKGH